MLGGNDVVGHLVNISMKEEEAGMKEPHESGMQMREYRKAQKECKDCGREAWPRKSYLSTFNLV